MVRIEPVPPEMISRALAVLAGPADLPAARAQARRLEAHLFGPAALPCTLWWALEATSPVAAVLVVHTVGRVGLVFHGCQGQRGRAILAALLAEATAAANARELAFTQIMLEVDDQATAGVAMQAGYLRLAELVYLCRRLDRLPAPPEDALHWEQFQPGGEQELGEIINRTYIESLDCPGLRGLRAPADVIASHKACGQFDPRQWWLPRLDGQPVGCTLVNRTGADGRSGELVYIGVRPEFRQRGLGRAMLIHAMAQAGERSMRTLYLAVDAANQPACKLYDSQGFTAIDRRAVLISPASGSGGAAFA